MSLHPPHLKDKRGNAVPVALIPFCAYAGNMTMMGEYVFDLDFPACNKFKPSNFNGQMCYALDLDQKAMQGKGYGLWLLMDPGTKILAHEYDKWKSDEERGYVSTKETIPKNYITYNINTLTHYSNSRAGMYVLSALKRKTATDDFLNLPDSTTGCHNEQEEICRFENSLDYIIKLYRAQKLKEESLIKCRCQPWFLGLAPDRTTKAFDEVRH